MPDPTHTIDTLTILSEIGGAPDEQRHAHDPEADAQGETLNTDEHRVADLMRLQNRIVCQTLHHYGVLSISQLEAWAAREGESIRDVWEALQLLVASGRAHHISRPDVGMFLIELAPSVGRPPNAVLPVAPPVDREKLPTCWQHLLVEDGL
jgi:hypothetical protein